MNRRRKLGKKCGKEKFKLMYKKPLVRKKSDIP